MLACNTGHRMRFYGALAMGDIGQHFPRLTRNGKASKSHIFFCVWPPIWRRSEDSALSQCRCTLDL